MANPIVEHMEVYPGFNFKRFSIQQLETAAEELKTQAETTDSQPLQQVYTKMAETIRGVINKRKRLTHIRNQKET